MLKRFATTFLAFIVLIVSTTLLLATTTKSESPGCEQNLANTTANVAAMQARLKKISSAKGPAICNATRFYFFEMVKARALTAACKNNADRERELSRLDADVEHINELVAARCG